ncbi:MAG: response regulator SirA, partial [Deltaproteobacteria bacterium]|nr:response regulator SirA [Deltaproteobacteria bacterium]
FVRWTDLRLLRRMVRDRTQRAKSPRQTLDHWHYVRRAEKKHILPFLGDADFVLNSAFPYELALWRPLTLDFFEDYVREDGGEPDALERAERVLHLLRTIHGVDDPSFVPRESVLREFLGGGLYG